MADEPVGEGGGLVEGGGSGGGSESVRQQRRAVSPARTVFGVILLVIAVAILILPIVWVSAATVLHGTFKWLYSVIWVLIMLAAAGFGWALLRKST